MLPAKQILPFEELDPILKGVGGGQKLNALKQNNLILEEQILSLNSWIPLKKGCGGIENGRVASPESEACYHNVFLMLHITVIHYLQQAKSGNSNICDKQRVKPACTSA